jgi:hypothetical protein
MFRTLVHILMLKDLLLSRTPPDSSQPNRDADAEGLKVWITLLDTQELLAQGYADKAKACLQQLGNLSAFYPGPVRLTRSLVLKSGFGEIMALDGIIKYGDGQHVESWLCFLRVLQTQLGALNKYSIGVVTGFLRMLQLSYPSSLPDVTFEWQSCEQGVPKGPDHRLMFLELMQCISAARYDVAGFEERMHLVTAWLQHSVPSAASGFLSELEQIARSAVLFQRLGMRYDLQKELHNLRVKCPLHVWLSPVLDAPSGIPACIDNI